MNRALKPFQETVVANAMDVLRHDVFGDTATGEPAYLLIEAPTGSGKTFMCGVLAERASLEANIVWFWFAPFAGLIKQTSNALRRDAPGLRIRDVTRDRAIAGTRTGNVFVMTWATVATERKESRRARVDDEQMPSIDKLVARLREGGFRIGVVVDEAHHSFVKAKSAPRFYSDVLKPDVTVMVTATPDDADLRRFEADLGIPKHYALTVSRLDAVAAGLIKKGIRTVAYLPDSPEAKRLVDVKAQALSDGVAMHRKIKEVLERAGVPLVPLMLVQVASDTITTVDDARRDLMRLGFPESAIAVYTAAEPDDKLETLAADETKEVLVFKMAVALGFDAPRAFTLVTFRGSKDTDFGTQIVGRIMRVHERLQGRNVDELLDYGYVFLSDERVQAGVSQAADRINAIATAFNLVAPGAQVVRRPAPGAAGGTSVEMPAWLAALPAAGGGGGPTTAPAPPAPQRYPIRADVPRRFQTERLPLDSGRVLEALVESLNFSDEVLASGLRGSASMTRVEREVFSHGQTSDHVQAQFSPEELARRAQKVLSSDENLNLKSLQPRMIERLRARYVERGMEVPADLNLVLNTILAVNPRLVRDATMRSLQRVVDVLDAAPLPDEVASLEALPPSSRNVYRVLPPGLNTPERRFAELLDSDTSGLIAWWHRNPVQRPESVAVVRQSGSAFYPDFIVGINGRDANAGVILVEVKGPQLLTLPDTAEKVRAKHRVYGQVLMVNLNVAKNAWEVVVYDTSEEKVVLGGAFRPSIMPTF